MALQTKEIWKEARWVKSRQRRRTAGTPGGTTMGIDPKLKTKIIHTYELESECGWFTGVPLQGKKRAQKLNDLAIITAYCPLYNKNRGAWNKIHADLKRAKGLLDPTQGLFQGLSFTDIVKTLHDAGTKIIIGGTSTLNTIKHTHTPQNLQTCSEKVDWNTLLVSSTSTPNSLRISTLKTMRTNELARM
jgi:hypothetical protein